MFEMLTPVEIVILALMFVFVLEIHVEAMTSRLIHQGRSDNAKSEAQFVTLAMALIPIGGVSLLMLVGVL